MSKWRITWREIGFYKKTGYAIINVATLPLAEEWAAHKCGALSNSFMIDLMHMENLIYQVKRGNKIIGHIKITSI